MAHGTVDITDFNFIAANFAPTGYDAIAAAVPEPSSLLLLALGLAVIGCYLYTRRCDTRPYLRSLQ